MRNVVIGLVLAGMLAGCGGGPTAVENDEGAVTETGEAIVNAVDDTGEALSNSIADAGNTIVGPVEPGPYDDWVGRWVGVEGLYLDVEKDHDKGGRHYKIANHYTLDDSGTFDGVATDEGIRFTRPDGTFVLHHTDGAATGMKYLADKQDCLTVKPGEGYCRD
ncbi:hypothetical protein [Stakelama saccharophila]|uniref:Lipoprotein n=1 Tax=Stakelama saccharophila TaxID=3075605 RepID=A0ABZ0BBF4_9SPHN|nr:hypothetical protein [Stakelama sp. W311]WNO54719.1 hypothetical protein RPR59_05585 [Stakelama sp. W311]